MSMQLSHEIAPSAMGPGADVSTHLAWALAIAAQRLPVHPLRPRSKLPATPHGFKDATTDPVQIQAWWQAMPDANVAIAVPDGVLVVDIDPRNGGFESVARICDDPARGLPDTRTVKTGGGGLHCYYAVPAGLSFPKGIDGGIDLKGLGGYVVAPPSLHESGNQYSGAFNEPIADAPPWLVALGRPRGEARERAARNRSGTTSDHIDYSAVASLLAPYFLPGTRHNFMRELGGYLMNKGASADDAIEIANQLPAPEDGNIEGREQAATWAWDGADKPSGYSGLRALGVPEAVLSQLEMLVSLHAQMVAQAVERVVERLRDLGVAPWGLAAPAANEQNETEASDTYEKIDATIARLADRSVYQRDGQLVRITRDAIDDSGVTRAAGAPTVRQLPQVRLGEIIATVLLPGLLADAERDYQAELAAATFPTKREQIEATHEARRQKAFERAASLGNKQAIVILARGEWAHIRPLDAIVTYPTMRPDGSILNVSGYDPQTRTLAELSVNVDLPEQPTIDDARASLQRLENLVRDFPFASAAHRSAWLAMVLTLVARPAINGPTPMGLFDATAAGSGKGLLCDVGSLITLGQKATVRVAPKTREEWDKSMLSLLSAADPLVVFDNISGMLGSDALEAVLTSGTFTQRQLGVSEDRKLQVRTVFWATANNARLSTDLVRRSLHCRLEPQCENPEARPESDFTHPQLREHVSANRAQYLADALTIVRAYAVADRPKVNARPMGSFEAWCRVVRDALVWAGGADPVETQAALRESADVERDEFSALAHAWHDALGDRLVTASELLRLARQSVSAASPLLEALTGLMPKGAEPTAHAVGNRLRMLRGKFVAGLALREGPKARNVATYQVVTV